MAVPGQWQFRDKRGVAAFISMSLFATLFWAISVVVMEPAGAATPGAAPPNPTAPCTWNWNRWSQPGAFSFPYTDSSFSPTQSVFVQASSALGANGWYEASVPPQFSYSGLREGVGPSEETTGPNDSEWTYGVGYYIMEPGSRQTISISDGDRQESHAFALYNSAGNHFARYPQMSDVNRGIHYVASEQEAKSDPTQAGGQARSNSWSASMSFTVPSDGIVYVHYLNFDERIRAQFATFSGACGPVAVDDVSTDNVPSKAVSVNVTENDSFVSPSTVSIVGADSTGVLVVADEGTWRVAGQGAISFTPEPGFVTNPTPIRYSSGDGKGKTARPAQLAIKYLPVFSKGDESHGNPTGETITVKVTSNDSNVNPRTIEIVGANTPSGGLSEPGRGTWSLDRSAGTISFTPASDVEADPRPIRYIVQDVGGNVLPAVTVEVSFAPESAEDESLDNIAGEIVAVDVVGNDPTFDIDPTSVAIVDANDEGDLVVEDEGTWSVDRRTNEIRFIPEHSFAGDPTPVMYTVADVDGNVAAPAEIMVDYLPVIRDDESRGHPAGAIITISVLENDPSNDIDPTSVAIDDPRYDRATRTLVVPGEGSWTVDAATGAITVTPEKGFRGEPAPISYVVVDDDENVAEPAELAIGHLPLPVGTPDESLDNDMGTAVTIDVLDNDRSAHIDPTTVEIVDADANGELSVSREGTWSVDPETGAITFDPLPRFDENPTPIEYIATDLLGVSAFPTSVKVTYRGVIPEVLAFAEPNAINWWTLLPLTALAALLVAAGAGLALSQSSIHRSSDPVY